MSYANTHKPPYYAVIFTSKLSSDDAGYSEMADRMVELVQELDGFLGFESDREDIGITVSYWRDLESIAAWKADVKHMQAQQAGREKWYDSYRIRIAKVNPNLEIEINDYAPSSHPWTSRKTIAEPTGATQILHKPHKYEHGTYSKNSISRFGVEKERSFG